MKRALITLALLGLCHVAHAFTVLNPVNPWLPPVQVWHNVAFNGPVVQAIQDAENQWTTVGNANFSFQHMGVTTDTNFQSPNNQTTVMSIANGAPLPNTNSPTCELFVSGAGVLGFALSYSGGNNSVDGYVVICTQQFSADWQKSFTVPWFVGVGAQQLPAINQMDFESVVAHELGHIVRLDHSCDGTPNNGIPDCATLAETDIRVTATMRHLTPWGDIEERTINADDIAGIQSIYGVFDLDFDDDGILNPTDNCPNVANKNQADFDKDGQGDACDSDGDNDGLSNDYEGKIGSNPLGVDSDGDGLSDGDEVNTYGSSPTQKDSDGDGISDGDEVKSGTSPILDEGAVLVPILAILLDDDVAAGPPPEISGVPILPVWSYKNNTVTVNQSTVIKSGLGLAFVKMECGGGALITGSPIFDPKVANNIYSFNIKIGPVAAAALCQISATDIEGQTTAASFQVVPQ